MQLPRTLTLKSDSLELRDWHRQDQSALETICADPELVPYTSIPREYSPAEAVAWIDRQRERRIDGTALSLAIVDVAGLHVVGNVNLVRFNRAKRSAAVGYWVIPEARRRGFASSAVRLLSYWAFHEFKLERIDFSIVPHNIASINLALSLGATDAGTETMRILGLNDPVEMRKFRLTQPAVG